MKNLIPFLVVLVGCSGADEGEPCDLAHRDGTYVQSFSERDGGTCGELSDQVVILSDGMGSTSGVPQNCAEDAPSELSADQCSLTRAYSCEFDGTIVSFVGVTTERDGGARLVGTVTSTVFNPDGSMSCRSTYDVTFTRQ